MSNKNQKIREEEILKELEEQSISVQDVREVGQRSYLEYSMSVIVSRALPDIRDGLKPVHRRILFSMNEQKMHFKSPYKKSARIVGDVIGKYHPHGDTSVYDAMVRMAQPFSMRTTLIDGQGNFGSIDGDGAAAMRYTEARMAPIPSKFAFDDLDPEIVEYIDNYDGNEQEAAVLPVKYPNLVINGIEGIAVGMASVIPPHNPMEAMNAVKYKVENRMSDTEDSIDDLLQIMPAPDFPTGGYIHGASNMREAWEKGTGKIFLRACWDIEEINGRSVVSIKEIPYQVNKLNLVTKMKELSKVDPETKMAKIEGVQLVEDYSDKGGMEIQVIIKPEYDAELVMNEFLAQTDLQKSYNYNGTVLVKENNRLIPKQVGLNEMFDAFIDFRLEVILNRTLLADRKKAAREHILKGLRKAIDKDNIEEVIKTIRANRDQASAKEALMALLDIDEIQATEVLQMRLAKLTGLEIDNIDSEIEEIEALRRYYKDLIDNENSRLQVILDESEKVADEFCNQRTPDESFYKGLKYPYRERLSEYQLDVIRTDLAAMTKEEECNIILSAQGFMRRVPISELTTMNRGARGKKQMKLGKDDFVQLSIQSHSHDALLFISDKGQCYAKFAYEISDGERGLHVNRLLSLSDRENEKIVEVISVSFEKPEQLIAMFTKLGQVKITQLSKYLSASRKGGIKAITLKEGDEILSATVCDKEDQIFMVNTANKIIRFPVDTVTVVGRTASGVIGMKLDKGVKVVGASTIKKGSGYIVCVSEKGLIKVTEESQYRLQSRNGKGIFAMKESERSGQLFNAFFVSDLEDEDVVFTTMKGYSNRRPLSSFKSTNRNTSGVMLTKLDEEDKLVDIFHAPHIEEEEFDLEMSEDSDFEITDSMEDTIDSSGEEDNVEDEE
jgi:DNA gyrase subunit A